MKPKAIVLILLSCCLLPTPSSHGEKVYEDDIRHPLTEIIGESPTAGMSSSKTTIELPSELFAL